MNTQITLEELRLKIKSRLVSVEKIIKDIEHREPFSDPYDNSEHTEWETELAYYEGKLDELQSIINQIEIN